MSEQGPPPAAPEPGQTGLPQEPAPPIPPSPVNSTVEVPPTADAAKAKLESRRALAIALMAGAFPAIAAIGGAIWSLIDKRQSTNLIWVGLLASVSLLFVSIYCGGRGIAVLNDSAGSKPRWFNRQSLYGLAGMICAVLSLGMWLAMPPKPSSEMESLKRELGSLRERLAVTEELQRREESEIAALRAEIAKSSQQSQRARQAQPTMRRHP